MAAAVPWVLATATILGQIVWVLADADGRRALTAVTVVTFFLASATHAWLHRGAAWAAGYLVVSLGFGLGVEVLGTRTQLPFGAYEYSDLLGPTVLGVPVLIPLAWSMMAYPCLLAARMLSRNLVVVPLVGAWLLSTWDLFLDPQMVGEGYWTWLSPTPALHGVPGIPVQNYLGWFVSALVLMLVLDRLPRRRANDAVPNTLLLWTWIGGIVANLFFFGRPWVALWGGVLMGLAMVPWAWRAWVTRP